MCEEAAAVLRCVHTCFRGGGDDLKFNFYGHFRILSSILCCRWWSFKMGLVEPHRRRVAQCLALFYIFCRFKFIRALCTMCVPGWRVNFQALQMRMRGTENAGKKIVRTKFCWIIKIGFFLCRLGKRTTDIAQKKSHTRAINFNQHHIYSERFDTLKKTWIIKKNDAGERKIQILSFSEKPFSI